MPLCEHFREIFAASGVGEAQGVFAHAFEALGGRGARPKKFHGGYALEQPFLSMSASVYTFLSLVIPRGVF